MLVACDTVFVIDVGSPDDPVVMSPGGGGGSESSDAGAGGSGASNPAQGEPALSSPPPPPFVIEEGGVLRHDDLGLIGYLYSAVAPLGVTCPDGAPNSSQRCVTNTAGRLCVRGQVDAEVRDARGDLDYVDRWGISFGFSSDPPWNWAVLSGVSFVVTGTNVPQLTLQAWDGPHDPENPNSRVVYCQEISLSEGPVATSLFGDLNRDCDPNLGEPPEEGAPLYNVEWSIHTREASQPFDFCIADMTPVWAQEP